MRTLLTTSFVSLLVACSSPAQSSPAGPQTTALDQTQKRPFMLSIVGTNDFHGYIERLPRFAGYLANIRRARQADGGAVLLVDAGDMFQGTLESNLGEGDVVVDAYNALGYEAAAVGNHEFDYGPVGPKAVATAANDEPRGALLARAKQAEFPFLLANMRSKNTAKPVQWPSIKPSTVQRIHGVRVGIIGVITEHALSATAYSNVADLQVAPMLETVKREATRLRSEGADVVITLAHEGARCSRFDSARDLSSCDSDQPILDMARALPHGLVDVIVGGHTHAAIAHEVNGIAIVESYAKGVAFSRVDLQLNSKHALEKAIIHPPQRLCGEKQTAPCSAASYEGHPVRPDPKIQRLLKPAIERAQSKREQALGVEVSATIRRSYASESALGNLLTDLLLEAYPQADVALVNGGSLRANLKRGSLSYGAFYEASPFDNRVALVKLRAEQLAQMMRSNLMGKGGILSLSGLSLQATCDSSGLRVELFDSMERTIDARRMLTIVTSDFLALGGDGIFGRLELLKSSTKIVEGSNLRELWVEQLRKRGGRLDPRAESLRKKRLRFQGRRPLRCRKRSASRGRNAARAC